VTEIDFSAPTRFVRISATDLDALEHLEADGPLTQRDLGDRLSLTSGAITMLVDRLEEAGWVHRRKHPSDRRYLLIELAPAALDAIPEGLARYHSEISRLAATVAVEHRSAMTTFLTEAADAAARATREMHR
jgi:DNA-binding MarR family transcriptional regulator